MAEQAPFTRKTLTFLRALKRNNDREWFRAHRDDYEIHVKAPMVLVIERLGREFRAFAPDLMADPKRSLYRIWRDTRFSADKRPLKTNAAAVFPHRRGNRHTSAGLYFEISEGWVWAGGGVYMPEPPALHRIRATITVMSSACSGVPAQSSTACIIPSAIVLGVDPFSRIAASRSRVIPNSSPYTFSGSTNPSLYPISTAFGGTVSVPSTNS